MSDEDEEEKTINNKFFLLLCKYPKAVKLLLTLH